MPINYISQINLKKFRGKTCLLRVDLNVTPPVEKEVFRIEAIVPTVKFLLKNRIKVVLLGHNGRPVSGDKVYSLKPFAPILSGLIGVPVDFISHFDFLSIRQEIRFSSKKVFLLENLRYEKGETENSDAFARKLAGLGDFFVNDAFAVSHRKNASVAAITKHLPFYAGLLFEKEIKNLDFFLKKPKKPFMVIIGGAKISDKLGVLKFLWRRAGKFLLAGGPANTFFAAKGLPVGESIFEKNMVKNIKPFLNSVKIVLPVDSVVSRKKILDIGPKTAEQFAKIISKAKTIVWNGPPGLFEEKEFAHGTEAIWTAVLKNRRARIVVGGGDTTASLKILNTKDQIPKNVFLSTGGGAMLEYLSGKKLPGIEALK